MRSFVVALAHREARERLRERTPALIWLRGLRSSAAGGELEDGAFAQPLGHDAERHHQSALHLREDERARKKRPRSRRSGRRTSC